MTPPNDYTTAAHSAESALTATTRSAENAFTTGLETWKSGLSSLTDQMQNVPGFGAFPQVDTTEAVERQFAFIRQVVDLNYRYAMNVARAFNSLNDVTREHLEQVSSTVRDQVQAVSGAAQSSVDTVEQAVRSQTERVEREAREQREHVEQAQAQADKDAAKAERQARKEAQDKARARYQSMNKTELTDELGKRDLPKTGTVDELIDRLVADDQKADDQK